MQAKCRDRQSEERQRQPNPTQPARVWSRVERRRSEWTAGGRWEKGGVGRWRWCALLRPDYGLTVRAALFNMHNSLLLTDWLLTIDYRFITPAEESSCTVLIGHGIGWPFLAGCNSNGKPCLMCLVCPLPENRRQECPFQKEDWATGMPARSRAWVGQVGLMLVLGGVGWRGGAGPVQGWQTPIRSQTQTGSGSSQGLCGHTPQRLGSTA